MGRTRSVIDGNIIEIRDIKKTFVTERKTTEVIGGISLDVKENEIVALFGPGQCGKTTVLNVMAGLVPLTSGTVVVNGETVTKPGPDRGFVYQTLALFPWMTVLGNVGFGPKVRGMSKKERIEKAKNYIDLVGLKGFENTYPVHLSGGMKQRVGIARAYCNEPSVLFLDEPFGHLDAQTRYLMQDELTRIWEKEKRTIVFVTNNIEEAIYLADRVIVLSNCPTTIKKEFVVDMQRPRDYVDPKFLALRSEITSVVDNTI